MPDPDAPFPIVAVGASAGGLKAFQQFVSELPRDAGMAFVLIPHLDPTRESQLREILESSTALPVVEVAEGMRVARNRIHVIPPNSEMSLSGTTFALRPRRDTHPMPIDAFFTSLAENAGRLAIGVVLSGTLWDGALGLRAIKAAGGITYAQDAESSSFAEMPRAAVAAGAVDFVLPPDRIAAEILKTASHPYLTGAAPARDEAEQPEPVFDSGDLLRLTAILRASTTVDFTNYRQSTLHRRIARRMALRSVDGLPAYVELLRKDRQEVGALYDDLLINVTSFFRDPEVFDILKSVVLLPLLKRRTLGPPLRVWVPGCSTGEEVYSLAITLFEAMEQADAHPQVQIFATDISETAIDKARAGVYLESAVADIPPQRLRRFFNKVDRGYQVSKSIREVCVFARQNLLADPPFSNLDLLSCRNVLIYLEPVLQKRVFPLFHYALRPGGHLVLGGSESVGTFEELFEAVHRSARIFGKKGAPTRLLDVSRRVEGERQHPAETAPRVRAEPVRPPVDPVREADKVVLHRFGPPGVLVNERFEILQFRGKTSPYLEASAGAASLNLLKFAREGLLVDLRAALLRAKKSGQRTRREGVRIRDEGRSREIAIDVIPIRQHESDELYFLVLFEGEGAVHEPRPHARAAPAKARAHARERDQVVARLEQELTGTKDYLQSVIESLEATNEELQSANEEILSSNEELQSTNEEIQTAKEELQSANEELTTVNDELQNRNGELSVVNADLSNLLAGINIAVVMTAADGRIRRFTAPSEKLLGLQPADVGRPLRSLRSDPSLGDLGAIAAGVVQTVTARELEVRDAAGKWYTLRARPYRTVDDRIDGAVLSFQDIEAVKMILEQAERARDYAEGLVETVRESLLVLDDQFRVRTANQPFYRIFERSPFQIEGRLLSELSEWKEHEQRLAETFAKIRAGGVCRDEQISVQLASGRRKTLLLNARRVHMPGDSTPLVLLALDDVTERLLAEKELRASEVKYHRLFETAREGILLLDPLTGRVLEANPFFAELFGLQDETIAGRSVAELGIFADGEAARAWFEAIVAKGGDYDPDVPMCTRAGETVHVEVLSNVYPMDEDHTVLQCNLRDVSERARLHEELRLSQKLEAVGRLAGGIAHDFNNILNIISAHAALLSRRGKGAGPENVEAIQRAVQRGAGVVRQLLTFAKRSDVEVTPVELNAVVEEVSRLLSETMPKSISFDLDLAPDLPRTRGDADQIHQALVNLCVNARDAMPNGGRMRLETFAVDSRVAVRVKDTGVGMNEETQRRAFEPFFTTKAKGRGDGLGLAVVYGIVNAHRGSIELSSEAGVGTIFTIFLPAVPEDEVTTGEDAVVERTAVNDETLLVVEDEPLLLSALCDILRQEGYRVLPAADGDEAFRVFEENRGRIDAVLTDVGLPTLGGWELFQKLGNGKGIPAGKVIFASGDYPPELLASIEQAGALTVRKPYTIGEVLDALRKAIDRR